MNVNANNNSEHQKGLHGAIAKLGPQVQAFEVAFQTLKGQLVLLEYEAQIAEAPHKQLGKLPEAPEGKVVPSEGDTGPTNDCSSARRPEIQLSGVGTNGLDVCVPPALGNRWLRVQTEMGVGHGGTMTRKTSRQSGGRLSQKMRVGGHPPLDGLWRDLYMSNEAEADDHWESIQAQRAKNLEEEEETDGDVIHSHCHTLHPYSTGCLVWLLSSLFFVLYDAFMIPLNVAWDRDLSTDNPIEFLLFCVTLLFWTADIFASFNTGYFDSGVLVMGRLEIMRHYCRTWLIFDVCVVSLDYVFLLAKAAEVQVFQSGRVLSLMRLVRGLRLGRILKVKSASHRLEELAAMGSVTKVIITMAVFNIFIVIFMLAHILTCVWFLIGRSYYEDGRASWLLLDDRGQTFLEATMGTQYARSLHWVIALMTTNTNDNIIAPENQLERGFTILVILLSIMIIGLGASKLGSTISELNRMNAEADATKSQLQRYLSAGGVSVDLSTRVIRFALYSLHRRCTMTLDPSVLALLSKKMEAELTVSQRSPHLMIHPLVKLINTVHPEALLDVCEAFETRLYSDGERIFSQRTWSEFLCVTANGTYTLVRNLELVSQGYKSESSSSSYHESSECLDSFRRSSSKDTNVETLIFSKPEWFSEISLFARVMHHSSLTATSFGDAFTLTGSEFAQSVRNFPACIATIYRYAMAYLGQVWDGPGEGPGMCLIDDFMPPYVAEDSCNIAQSWLSHLDLNALFKPEQSSAEDVTAFISRLCAGGLTDQELIEQIPQYLPELREETGTYATMAQSDERKRSLLAVLCVYWLRNDCYESFVELQPERNKMTRELWDNWQRFVRWVSLSDEMFHAMLVFVSIRGLGKVQAFQKCVSRDNRSPEDIVLHLLREAPFLVPSMSLLSPDMQDLVIKAFGTHSEFNMAQMLQGENIVSHVQNLQDCIQAEGEELLKFYLFNLVGMMCALRGVETLSGSLFMDQNNGTTMLVGIHCLQHLTSASPHAIYWTYINSRAVKLQLPTDEPEHFAIARLACLIRASPADIEHLQGAWSKLNRSDRLILTEHFLADGIEVRAYLLAFLPLYFANARNNKAVGLHLALLVLIDLLELLRADGCGHRHHGMTLNVSLADIASFASQVKVPRLFELVAGFARVVYAGTEVRVTISTRHWQRVNQKGHQEEPLQEMNHVMQKMNRKSESLEAILEKQEAIHALLERTSWPRTAKLENV